jgi:carboxyl-terminal processing protease
MSLGVGKGALKLTTALYHGPSGRTVQRTGVVPDVELVPPADTPPRSRGREADRPTALPGADEPPPPKARVEQSLCPASRKEVDGGLACALAFLQAGGIDNFVASLQAPQATAAEATAP